MGKSLGTHFRKTMLKINTNPIILRYFDLTAMLSQTRSLYLFTRP